MLNHLFFRGALSLVSYLVVGVDWKSLSTPAILPLTTDFFPKTSSLHSEDFMVHEYRVVLTTMPSDKWNRLYE